VLTGVPWKFPTLPAATGVRHDPNDLVLIRTQPGPLLSPPPLVASVIAVFGIVCDETYR
jgi:hypothetical protein